MINEEEFTEDYGNFSDSDLEDEEDTALLVSKNAMRSGLGSSHLPAISNRGKRDCGDHEECVEQGKVVKIPDVAFVT